MLLCIGVSVWLMTCLPLFYLHSLVALNSAIFNLQVCWTAVVFLCLLLGLQVTSTFTVLQFTVEILGLPMFNTCDGTLTLSWLTFDIACQLGRSRYNGRFRHDRLASGVMGVRVTVWNVAIGCTVSIVSDSPIECGPVVAMTDDAVWVVGALACSAYCHPLLKEDSATGDFVFIVASAEWVPVVLDLV